MRTTPPSSNRVRLLEVDPDLGSELTPEEFAEARQLAVPVVTIPRHERNIDQLVQGDPFGALVLGGMVLRRLRVADQTGMRLLGPGDVVSLLEPPAPMLVAESSLEAAAGTRLALLGREVLFAASRWPKLIAGLELRRAQQTDRLAAQLVICQLPRVDQRLLALLWLLAESWGRVTPAGTALPLKLTHEAMGALIGARRPTVTLALRELTERGAIVRQREGILLLESPAAAQTEGSEPLRPPELVGANPSTWAAPEGVTAVADSAAAADVAAYGRLKDAVERLRVRHAHNRDHFNANLRAYTAARERITLRRPPSPSS